MPPPLVPAAEVVAAVLAELLATVVALALPEVVAAAVEDTEAPEVVPCRPRRHWWWSPGPSTWRPRSSRTPTQPTSWTTTEVAAADETDPDDPAGPASVTAVCWLQPPPPRTRPMAATPANSRGNRG